MSQPKIDLEKLENTLTTEEFKIVKGIVATRGKNKGCLRASKPKVTRKDLGPEHPGSFYHKYEIKGGKTAYVWRMVAFYASSLSQHHCMPCTADFDLPADSHDERMKLAKRLDKLVDKVLDTIPVEQWSGVRRWRNILG